MTRTEWYAQLAEQFGEAAIAILSVDDEAHLEARLAGHFGNLALGPLVLQGDVWNHETEQEYGRRYWE